MNHRTLGRTGIQCSEIGLGTWAFASRIYGSVSRGEAIHTIERALDLGVTFFDTAPLYGDKEQNGIAEKILGEGLGSKREKVILSTKFGRYATESAAPHFHARRAIESVEGSLRRLQTDYIDILFFHSPFGLHEIHDDVWEALDRLRQEGKIRFVGHSISKFEDTEQMARAWARERKIDLIQVVYSLMNRKASRLIKELNQEGVAIVARESLANGFLSGRITANTVFPEGTLNARYSRSEIEKRVSYVESLKFLLREEVKTMPQAAYRWVLDHPAISVVLSGASNVDELEDVAASSRFRAFSDEEHNKLALLHKEDFQAA